MNADKVRTIELQTQTFADVCSVSLTADEMFQRAMWDAQERRLVAFILGTKPEKVSASWPADWREALKERWLPEWAKRRWPVRYSHVSMTKCGLYPEIPWDGKKLRAVHFIDRHQWTETESDDG